MCNVTSLSKRKFHHHYHHHVTCHDFMPSLRWSTQASLSPRLAWQDTTYSVRQVITTPRSFVLALRSVECNTLCLLLLFPDFTPNSDCTPEQLSSAANGPNTKLFIQPSFATVYIAANGWWIFRCHCHYKARNLVCALIRRYKPINIDHWPI